MNAIIDNEKDVQAWASMTPPTPTKFWHDFKKIVDYIRINFPEEYIDAETEAKEQRETARTKFGESKTGFMRNVVILPSRLESMIKILYGMRMPFANSTEYYKQIWKRYPLFRASEKY